MHERFEKPGVRVRGRSRFWRTRVLLRQWRVQWRLVLAVTTVAVLAATLIASLGVLVTATERSAIRGAFAAAEPADTQLAVRLTQPSLSADEGRERIAQAVQDVLGPAASSASTTLAFSEWYSVPRERQTSALVYFGELEPMAEHASLLQGSWPAAGMKDGPIPVAVPEAAAELLDLEPGDVLEPRTPRGELQPAEIVGIYEVDDPDDLFWSPDMLHGTTWDSAFELGSYVTDAVGPFVVAPSALQAAGIPLNRIAVGHIPDFTRVTADDLTALSNRLDSAAEQIPVGLGPIAESVDYSSSLDVIVRQAVTALVVTRATVVVVSILLLIIAVAVLTRAARLLNEARMAERQLMRARGASTWQLLSIGVLEATSIALLTAALSPLLARWMYQLVAMHPAMSAAGMAFDPGLPPAAWLIAAAVAAIFAVVLFAPALRSGGTFLEAEQGKARPQKNSLLHRAGLDVALVVLAGIAYWQLLSYRSPVSATASLWIDPVLAAAPGLALLAGALLCVRLIPAAARPVERIGAGMRSAVLPLAAWEVGRRTQGTIAAVLLLTIALSVGTFSQSFLATWRQSQVDQAAFAIGPPVRVDSGGQPALERNELDDHALGVPQPVLRRPAILASADARFTFGREPSGADAVVLGLGSSARELLDRGRLAREGGATLVDALDGEFEEPTGIALPDHVRGLSATISIHDLRVPLSGVVADVRAVVRDRQGLITTIDFGTVPIDDEEHEVSALLPAGASGVTPDGPVELVGLHALVHISDVAASGGRNSPERAVLLVKDLAALIPGPDAAVRDDLTVVDHVAIPVEIADDWRWYGKSVRWETTVWATQPNGWQLGMGFWVPPSLQSNPQLYVTSVWRQFTALPAVLSADLAGTTNAERGDRFTLVVDDVLVPIEVAGIVDRVPGGGPGGQRDVLDVGASGSTGARTVAVDQKLLAQVLARNGMPGAAVDEWWVDVAPGQAGTYLAGVDEDYMAQSSELLATRMLEHPLRAATQGALVLAIVSAALLAAIGFGAHAAGSLRSRSAEFARLRAIGLSRRRLTSVIAVESLVIGVIGTALGIALGALLGWLVGPLVGVSASGAPPIPDVAVNVPWLEVGLFAVEVAAVLAATVLVVARVQRSIDPAAVLRMGEG